MDGASTAAAREAALPALRPAARPQQCILQRQLLQGVQAEGWVMFSEQAKHERGIKRPYVENVRRRRLSFQEAVRLRRRGATIKTARKHLDRKEARCYPRGPAFLRIVDMHSVAQLMGRDG